MECLNKTVFDQTKTVYSQARSKSYQDMKESGLGLAVEKLFSSTIYEEEIERIILDLTCFRVRNETNKLEWMSSRLDQSNVMSIGEAIHYLRWLPNSEVDPLATAADLATLYANTMEKLVESFSQFYAHSENFGDQTEILLWIQSLENVCERFNLKSKLVTLGGMKCKIPIGFVPWYQEKRRETMNGINDFIPLMIQYLLETQLSKTSAYTVEDIIYKQIADTEDLVRHRRSSITIDQLLESMQNNVDASQTIWDVAISEQKKDPTSPYFIIANERTGPSDVAAEGFSNDFAEKMHINNTVNYQDVTRWFLHNQEKIDQVYEEFIHGESIPEEIYEAANRLFNLDEKKIIPMYRLRIPSNHHEMTGRTEPLGFELIISFIKFISLLRGRILFTDESTRSAPRSMEILYSGLCVREMELGGIEITPYGKILGITGQRGVTFNVVKNETAHCKVGFIDPWIKPQKPITDDSEGFTPQIQGNGVVEIIDPGWGAISPFGITSLQELWKKCIASEVERRILENLHRHSVRN